MFRRQHHSGLLYALLIGATLLLLAARVRHAPKKRVNSLGRLTSEQVIRMSRPICESIAPQYDALCLSTEPSADPLRLWKVTCQDKTGHDIAHLIWNADTTRLCSIASYPQPYSHSKPILNASEAVASAGSWLRLLSATSRPVPFHLLRAPYRLKDYFWSMEWKAERQHACIYIEAHSGDLLHVEFWTERTEPPKPNTSDRDPLTDR